MDLTSLLVNGEGYGWRQYMFHYSGNRLAAVRMGHHKFFINPGTAGGLPNMEIYNIQRDPGEKFGSMYSQLWAVTPFQKLIGSHKSMLREFPHRKIDTGTF